MRPGRAPPALARPVSASLAVPDPVLAGEVVPRLFAPRENIPTLRTRLRRVHPRIRRRPAPTIPNRTTAPQSVAGLRPIAR